MRYFLSENTLFIRGSFRAASTRIAGRVLPVVTLLIHTISPDRKDSPPEKELEQVAAGAGIGPEYAGLFTTVPMQDLCVLQYDFLTVFIMTETRSVAGGGEDEAGTISIIICSGQGMTDDALLETVTIATEATAEALRGIDRNRSGPPSDAVIVACEGAPEHRSAGASTPVGTRVRAAILHGIKETIRRQENTGKRNRPSFYIYSRFKGEHWIEWSPEDCPYYPCHFPGQRCDFCYCPLYPCGDEELGQWVDSSNGGKVWNCARCTMIHEPAVADHLQKYPEASKEELVRIFKSLKK